MRVRCPVPVETRFSIRPFALRQRQSTFRRTPAAGSTFLACIFETIPEFSLARSVLSRPVPVWLFCIWLACEARSMPTSPVSSSHPGNSSACTQTSAPRQDLSIPSDRSAQPDSKRRGLPLRVARFSFAPRLARIITYPLRVGSLFRIRYFPPGSLSFEPLGTLAIMRLDPDTVK